MASDDIRDLLGRYAMGPLTAEEREKLFDAALNDQNLFEELAREQEIKMMLDEPGARDRMIRALDASMGAPNRAPWILAAATLTASLVVAFAFLLYPFTKQPQVALTIPAPPAPVQLTTPEPPVTPTPVKRPSVARLEPPVAQPLLDQPADRPTNSVVQQARAQFVPRAQAPAPPKVPPFGFHYSLDTKGHLVIVPEADGYLFAKSDDGSILYERKQIAAAITTDIPIPDAVRTATVTFSQNAAPVDATPSAQPASSATVEGPSPLAVTLTIPRKSLK